MRTDERYAVDILNAAVEMEPHAFMAAIAASIEEVYGISQGKRMLKCIIGALEDKERGEV